MKQNTEFLTHHADLKTMPERSPFQKTWVNPQMMGSERKFYTKIYVAPVSLDYLVKDDKVWEVRIRDISKHKDDLNEIAQYMQNRFKKTLNEWPDTTVKVVDTDTGQPDTVVLELAIVNLVPTETTQKAAASVVGLLVPGGGLLGAGASGSIAIEGRVRDSATKEIFAEFADRESDKVAPVDLASFKWYSRSKDNIDDWADQFAELANTKPDHQVKSSLPFTLNPF